MAHINRNALVHLRDFPIPGTFHDTHAARASVTADKLSIISTVDSYGRFLPGAANSKERDVAVIVNPSGIKKLLPEQRKLWAQIEGEVAFQAALAYSASLDEVIYIDLARSELHRLRGAKKRLG